MLFLLALSCLLVSATAMDSSDIMIEKTVARRVCMRSRNFDEMAFKMNECGRIVMPKEDDDGDDNRHGDDEDLDEESFNLADFVKGYCAQKICTFEELGWLKDCGSIDPMRVREFMYQTRLGPAFGENIGDEVVKECMAEAATITPNEFFNGIEPNNQKECNCDGECKGDKVCDCEGDCDCDKKKMCDCEGDCDCAERAAAKKAEKKKNKKRFSFRQMLEGARQELDEEALEKAQEEMLNSAELSEEEIEAILEASSSEEEDQVKGGSHSHIHIPRGNQDDETDIDIVEEFARLSKEEKREVMMMLRPITFFKCVMEFFDITCESYIGSSLESTLMPPQQPQFMPPQPAPYGMPMGPA